MKSTHPWSKLFFSVLLLLASTGLFACTALPSAAIPPDLADQTSVAKGLALSGNLPLSFEANQGQTDGQVKFFSRGNRYNLFLTETEAVFAFRKAVPTQHIEQTLRAPTLAASQNLQALEAAGLRMQLVNANPRPAVTGQEELPGKVNYFIGNNPAQWRTNVPTYAKVKYQNVYPGVDLVYYGNQRQLEYDFVVAPGSDPTGILLGFEGADHLELTTGGDLILHIANEQVRMQKPTIYQEVAGVRREVVGGYVLKDKDQIAFHVGAYDVTRPLVIDPVLMYAGYIGGAGQDFGNGIALDSNGYVYIVGYTDSNQTGFPVTSGPDLTYNSGQDVFVAKLTADGTQLVYSGYIGGAGQEFGMNIAVDEVGNVYIVGYTNSTETTFPVTVGPDLSHNGSQDTFVAKVSADGSNLLYAGYIGGSGEDFGHGIAVDGGGNLYAVGITGSNETTFPVAVGPDLTFNGPGDGYVAKVKADGTGLVYAGYIGGSGDDALNAVAVERDCSVACQAYVAGSSASDQTTLPVVGGPDLSYNGGTDAFVAKLKGDGTGFVYAGYIGGSRADYLYSIAVDSGGNAYVYGNTDSTEATFPVTVGPGLTYQGGRYDAFVAKLNATGTALIYNGYIGGAGDEFGRGIAVDDSGNAYVTGWTSSTEATFPILGGPDLTYNGGPSDAFVVKVNTTGTALDYAGYIGGSGEEMTGHANPIAVDRAGNTSYVIGSTSSNEATFPVTVGPDVSFNGATDSFVAKVVSTPVACVPPPADLVSWWSWEGNGADQAGTNPAMLIDSPTFAMGKVGQALQLNGSSGHAKALASASLNVGAGNGLTIDAWIKPAVVTERPGGMPLFEWNTGSTIGAHLWVSAVSLIGNLYANLTDTNGGWHQISSAADLVLPNVYQHVAVTYDRTSGLSLLYLNGVVVDQQNFGVFTPQTGYDLYFGRRGNVGDPYNGQLDEVHLFNRALSSAEIQAIYNADIAGLCQSGSHNQPVTTASVSPSPDAQGIYPGPVTVSLAATAASGFTVSATYYTIDGGAIQTYTGPFVVSADGIHAVEYWSVDNSGMSELRKMLTIQIASLRITTESPLPSGTVGATYSVQLTAAGGTPPYTWSVVAGSLPPGLALDAATGLISGIPTTAGTFGFTIQVRDSSSAVASKPFAFAEPPSSGSAGSNYTLPILIDPAPGSGGNDPGTCTNYTVTSGSLPPGLTLDPNTGVVSGTPINGGTYNFTVGCTVSGGQNNGQTATKDFAITIYNLAPTITTLDPSSATAGGATFVLTVNGTNFVTASTVHWNGVGRTTTYVSATQLQAEILATDIANAGGTEVTVVNPQPGGGVSNSATFTIIPANQPPTVQAGGPYQVAEGGSVALAVTGSDPENNPLTYAWDLDNDGTFETLGQNVTFSATGLDGPGTQTVAVQVTDNGGLSASASTAIDVQNVAPTANLAATPDTIDEGQSATLSFSNQADPGVADIAAGFLYSYDCTGDGDFEVVDVATASSPCAYADNGAFSASGRIKDKDGGFNDYTVSMTVHNVAPVVGAITAPIDPVAVNTAINTNVSFSDPGVLDTHTAMWDWGDGTTSVGTINETNGSGLISGSYTYATAGIYTLKVTVTDDDGDAGESVFRYIVVYDPSAGFVTGGGWSESPTGAYAPDLALTGKAKFGFVAKYKKGTTVPTGQTEFQFQLANMDFHSTSYDWLVVAGAKAQFKGTGPINGSGNYGFLLTAIDGAINGGGSSDKFRIKIWDKNNGDTVVYDNKMGESEDSNAATTIGGGSIVIHKGGANAASVDEHASTQAIRVFLPLVER